MRTLNGSRSVEDSRNDLLFEFLRFIEELKPKTIMLENVPGLARDKRFFYLCKRLQQIGYHFQHRILNAAEYCVPQRRHRLILLGGLKGPIPFAVPSKKNLTVRDAIAFLPPSGKSGDPLHDLLEKRSKKIQNLIKRIPKNGGSRNDLPKEEQLDCHKKCNGFKDVYGRMAWDDVAPTITSGCFNPSKGRFLHPIEDRAITLREASLLQGFPPDYKFPNIKNKSAIALLIGNALPPPFITAHARSILKILSGKKVAEGFVIVKVKGEINADR
jgi:DNA (cytosine-5)-methyltransferase 1